MNEDAFCWLLAAFPVFLLMLVLVAVLGLLLIWAFKTVDKEKPHAR